MPTEHRFTDFWIGLVVLTTVAVVVGALIATSNVGVRQFDLYFTASSALSLTSDTRVQLQGLEIGRVHALSPRFDTATGELEFVAHLRIDEHFPDGSAVMLPAGMVADIEQSNPIAAPVISLRTPEDRTGATLRPGDTIVSIRRVSALDRITSLADSIEEELRLTLTDARGVMRRLGATAQELQAVLATVGPGIDRTIEAGLVALAQADTVLRESRGMVGILGDTLELAVADARSALRQIDSAATVVAGIADYSEAEIKDAVDAFNFVAKQMNHLVEQISRRPLRFLTGVNPLSRDSLEQP